MVPFSFKPELSYSRVMNEYSMGVLDDGINGFLDHWVQRHAGLESGDFALSCLLAFLMVIPAPRLSSGQALPPVWRRGGSRKSCEKPNEIAKFQGNCAKSPMNS
jgi:hypothetical protein